MEFSTIASNGVDDNGDDDNIIVMVSTSAPLSLLPSNGSSHPVPFRSWYQSQQVSLYIIQVAVAFFGIFTNTINIATFLKIGLSESVTTSFFMLSISDMLHLLCFCVIRMLSILQYEHGLQSDMVRLQDLGGCFGWLALYFMDVSMYITVYITFQKCCCVVFPLAFKNVFTTKRSVAVTALIYVTTLSIFLPLFVNIVDKWMFDPKTKHLPLDWIKLNSGIEATVWRWLHRIVLTPTSQVIIVVCLLMITVKLKQSVKFRTSHKAKEESNDDVDVNNQDVKLGQREVRAIQSVQLIALIFIVSTVPSTVNSLVTVLYPAINLPHNRSLVFTIQAIMYFGGTINASCNFFVYLKYNTRYYNTIFLDSGIIKLLQRVGRGDHGSTETK